MPNGYAKSESDIGHRFGKSDLERIGVFAEMDYMNGKGYVSPFSNQLCTWRSKGHQLLTRGPKSKCGTQDGYFQKKFLRIFEKEAYLDVRGMFLQAQKESSKKNISKTPFVAPGPTKEQCSPGDHYGTFGGKVEAFSPLLRRKPPYRKEPPLMLTKPGKKGGPGYVNITLSNYPTHSADFYDAGRVEVLKNYAAHKKGMKGGPLWLAHCPQPYFDPNPYYEDHPGPTYIPPKEKRKPVVKWITPSPSKWPGGCKDGCFDKWPIHSEGERLSKAEMKRDKLHKTGKVFFPPAHYRTMYTCSIVNRKIDSAMNANNRRNFQPITFPNP